MSLFTVIADYEGGTYISQHRASSPSKAILRWVDRESFLFVDLRLTPKQKENLKKELEGDSPVRLMDTVSAWCKSATLKRKLLLLNIIKTKET